MRRDKPRRCAGTVVVDSEASLLESTTVSMDAPSPIYWSSFGVAASSVGDSALYVILPVFPGGEG